MSEPFYQFPLAILAAGETAAEKFDLMTAVATIEAGMREEKRIGKEQAIELMREEINTSAVNSALHRAWFLGKGKVNFTWQTNPKHCITIYEQARKFLNAFGKSPFVRVKTDLFREAQAETFAFRDFAVMCAVYSIIGEKSYAIVRRNRVRAGALGYSSASALFDEDGNITPDGEQLLSRRPDHARPLSLDQCRYTLDRLHERKFFSRIQPKECGRVVYYSRGADHDTLAGLLFKKVEKQIASTLAQDEAQATLRDRAASLLKRVTGGDSKQAEKVPAHSPQESPQESPDSPRRSPRFNTCSPNTCPSNECSTNECSGNACAAVAGTHTESPEDSGFREPPSEPNNERIAELVATALSVVEAAPEWKPEPKRRKPS